MCSTIQHENDINDLLMLIAALDRAHRRQDADVLLNQVTSVVELPAQVASKITEIYHDRGTYHETVPLLKKLAHHGVLEGSIAARYITEDAQSNNPKTILEAVSLGLTARDNRCIVKASS